MNMNLEKTSIYSDIDPYFQRLLEKRESGLTAPATASTVEDEVAVIARVSSLEDWESMSEVLIGSTIGEVGEGILVTGRIPVSRIEAVRQAPCVLSLKPAQSLRPMLSATIEETDSRADLLPADATGNQGEGVIVAIVDYDCDFMHENFRNADGTTRLLGIWDQRAISGNGVPYGHFYNRDEINRALRQRDPYDALGYSPSDSSHGTHVMDIAAGNGNGSGVSGVAPNTDLLFIHPDTSDVPWTGVRVIGRDFSDSVHLLEAVKFAFDTAETRPCVVNLSLGTNGGPHDGTGLVEQGFDSLVSAAPNRAVVIAASNSFDDRIHAAGTVPQGSFIDIPWEIADRDQTSNEVEIWYRAGDEFALELFQPNGDSLGTVDLGSSGRVRDDRGNTVLFIAHRSNDPGNGDNNIGIYVEANVPGGVWTLRLHGVRVTDGGFHAWVERDDRGQSNFAINPPDNSHTLGSISTGHKSIVVGSYDAHKASLPLSWFSSAGPTRDGREKPELSAPGHQVSAARSTSGSGTARKSGTSMAAPAVSGVIAVIYSEALARGQDLSVDELRDLLQQTTGSSPPSGGWDPRYGSGRVNAAAAVRTLIDR
jgi:subtilisin family serine protease